MKLHFLLTLNIICSIYSDATHSDSKMAAHKILRSQPVENTSNVNSQFSTISETKSEKKTRTKRDGLVRPNIVIIVADDLGYNNVGYHGNRMGYIADTPSIDNLAYSGVRLENYYVQPTCTPTRASLMTGRYPIRLGLQLGNIDAVDPTCLPLKEKLLPEKLGELGYVTHAVGKWHLGFSRTDCLPTRRGFDSYFGIITGYASYYTRSRQRANTLYNNETVEWGYKGVHSSELYTQRAVDIIKNHNKNKPLFLYLSHQAVHSPMDVPMKYQMGYIWKYPQTWHKMPQTKVSQNRKAYLGLVKSLDVSVDIVVETLKNTGLWDNTVLVFTSDNGGKGSSGGNNWPLRGKKNTLWEGGIKGVGFIASPRLPPHVRGTVQEGLMHVSDWFPTLVEGVAGGDAEGRLPLDGFNMWPTIAGNRLSPRSEILHNIATSRTRRTPKQRKIYKERRKDQKKQNILDQLPFDPKIVAAIRYGEWKLISGPCGHRGGAWQPPPEARKPTVPMLAYDHDGIYLRLYNIKQDPTERNNVAMSHPDLVMDLLNRLRVYDEHSVKPRHGKDGAALPVGDGDRRTWGPWIS